MNPFHSTILLLLTFLLGCSSSDNPDDSARYRQNELIYRTHDDSFLIIPAALPQTPSPYPWEKGCVGSCQKITKDFFRCRGSSLNPVRSALQKDETIQINDCGGTEKHSLPLRNQKEFIYPILIELLNYIQAKTQKQVVITSGHRCPDHNMYVDASSKNQTSKHMIGAEVSFYVQSLEERPDLILKHIFNYYKETSKYQSQNEYTDFQRYTKGDTDVSTQPWSNKEIFLKLYKKNEGRNFDNRHPYPYISIQVRYDRDKKEKVIYTWQAANQNFLRY